MASARSCNHAIPRHGRLGHATRWVAFALVAAAVAGAVADTAPPGMVALVGRGRSPSGDRLSRTTRSAEVPADRGAHEPTRLLPSTGHIRIPSIGVDAPLISLGTAPGGTLEVPVDPGVAGWFSDGPFPGEVGPAVVVGHVDWTSGPAVFYRLRDLRRGALIVVLRQGERRSRFQVRSLRWFAKSDFPTQRVYGPVTVPVLRLITCGGAFGGTGHCVDDLVVFAVPLG